MTLDILRENALNHFAFGRFDLEFTRAASDSSISVGSTAGMPTIARYPGHPATNFLGQVLQEDGPEEPTKTDLNVVGDPFVHAEDLNADIFQALVDTR